MLISVDSRYWCRVTTTILFVIYTVSKNDTDVALYSFDAHQSILVIFGRDVAEKVCYRTVTCFPTSPN